MATNINAVNHILKNGRERLTSGYGNRTITVGGKKVTSFHSGNDIVSSLYGTDYLIAFAEGTVRSVNNGVAGYSEKSKAGNYVTIDHGNGYITKYFHMKNNTITVKVGQHVNKGDIIGYMGSTGYSTGNHCHFGVFLNNSAVDPLPYFLGTKNIPVIAKDTPYSGTGTVTANSLNVRKGPGTVHGIVGVLKKGTGVKMIAESGNWFKINYNSGTAYVSKDYVAVTVAPPVIPTPPVITESFNVGDVVGVKPGARSYTGGDLADFIYKNVYVISQIKGDRAVLDQSGICTPVSTANLFKANGSAPTPAPAPYVPRVGDRVKVRPGAKSYNGKFVAKFIYNNSYVISEINGNRAVLDKSGICTPFKTSDLIKA